MSLVNDDVTVVLPGLGGLQTSQQSTLGGGLFNKGLGPTGGLGTGLSKIIPLLFVSTEQNSCNINIYPVCGFKQSVLTVGFSVVNLFSTHHRCGS